MNPRSILLRSVLLSLTFLALTRSVCAAADGFSVLHHFGGSPDDGTGAMNELVSGLDGDFYGTTRDGGRNGLGTVFKITRTGTYTLLHHFSADDGSYPTGALAFSGGRYYGTTEGDTGNGGTIFSVAADGSFAVHHIFDGYGADGFGPAKGMLTGRDFELYGVSNIGGGNRKGSVFHFALPDRLTTLYSFTGDTSSQGDGRYPVGSLFQATDGTFYGSTVEGYGSIFSLDSGGKFTTLYRFSANDHDSALKGYGPGSPLIQGPDGTLYGTTGGGGANFAGTLFKITRDGTLTTLHSFGANLPEGASPKGRLGVDSNGTLYGTTTRGANGYGSIYAYDRDGTLTVLHRFVGSDGDSAESGLVQGGDAALYGVTRLGGLHGEGTIFRVTTTPVATIAATVPSVLLGTGQSAEFTVTLSRAPSALAVVRYQIAGSAVNGTDYDSIRGNVRLGPGETRQVIKIFPRGEDFGGARKKTVKLTLLPSRGCTVDGVNTAKAKLLAPSR